MMTLNFLTPGHHTMKKSRGQKGNNVYNTRVAKTENFIFAATIFEKSMICQFYAFSFQLYQINTELKSPLKYLDQAFFKAVGRLIEVIS